MRTKKLLAVGAVAVGMLAIPPAALVGDANQSALAQPTAPRSVVTPVIACATHLRWVKPRGPEGGHYAVTCGHLPRWVPGRGAAGGHYAWRPSSCVRWVPGRGPASGKYAGTCGQQPPWVAGRGPGSGRYHYSAASAIESSTKPIASHTQASKAPSPRLDRGSAGIAATVLGALAIALAAITGLRQRHITRPQMP
jgi:hypothetical protein